MWKTTLESPVGRLYALATDEGLRALVWRASELARLARGTETLERTDHPLFARLAQQLGEYFAGTRQEFDLPLDPVGTEFQRAAWDALSAIPYGATRTYGEQAAVVGRPSAARAIGAANGRNPLSIVVPCHRVIGAGGALTGFAGGVDAKRFLLELESGVAAGT